MPGPPRTFLVIVIALLASVGAPRPSFGADPWFEALHDRITLYGHRNWIVIADSAYPAQSREGIETVIANAEQLDVVRRVLGIVGNSRHVRANIFTDQELSFVPESDAPGVSQYRRNLAGLIGSLPVTTLPHEQIISKLDEAGKTFRVLIIKTNMAIPYTSVFIQLDCAYWGADAEKRLREAMSASPSQ